VGGFYDSGGGGDINTPYASMVSPRQGPSGIAARRRASLHAGGPHRPAQHAGLVLHRVFGTSGVFSKKSEAPLLTHDISVVDV
jgi:hypothetical protein